MKKIVLLLLLVFISLQFNAQDQNINIKDKNPQDLEKKYELKINTFNLIVFAALDLSYERLINESSSYGIGLFYNFSDYENDNINFPKKFSMTPYYRWFFSESKYARGFFVEGFGMLNTYQNTSYNYNSDNYYTSIDNHTAFALGISVGGKFVTKAGFTTEVLLGVGRNLIKGERGNDFLENEFVGRFGISLGYRF